MKLSTTFSCLIITYLMSQFLVTKSEEIELDKIQKQIGTIEDLILRHTEAIKNIDLLIDPFKILDNNVQSQKLRLQNTKSDTFISIITIILFASFAIYQVYKEFRKNPELDIIDIDSDYSDSDTEVDDDYEFN